MFFDMPDSSWDACADGKLICSSGLDKSLATWALSLVRLWSALARQCVLPLRVLLAMGLRIVANVRQRCGLHVALTWRRGHDPYPWLRALTTTQCPVCAPAGTPTFARLRERLRQPLHFSITASNHRHQTRRAGWASVFSCAAAFSQSQQPSL